MAKGFFSTLRISGEQKLSWSGPSHRARIPATTAISVPSAALIGIGIVKNQQLRFYSLRATTALDMEQAVVYQRSTYNGAFIEQRWYAHQVFRGLLIHEIYVNKTSSSSVSIPINNS